MSVTFFVCWENHHANVGCFIFVLLLSGSSLAGSCSVILTALCLFYDCFVSVCFFVWWEGQVSLSRFCLFVRRWLCLFALPWLVLALSFSLLYDCFMSVSLFVWCLLVGCLTFQQQASVSQGRICSDNFTCCHTEIEVADPTFYLTQSQYTDTGPTSPSTDPITPVAWQGSHWSANF